jgi:NAD(P)-dependent dehydrogenase (short-subunit alcohol dehydrogenase family)
VEEITEAEARAQIETNLYGALWITQAAIPLLRAQGGGHIMQVSSIGGVTAFPGVGIYHASKWALEGLSEALAQEVRPAGIKVTLIEPGAYGTDWAGSSGSHSQPNPAYQPFRDAVAGARSALTLPGPQDTADAVLAAADAADPPLRLLLSGLAYDLAQRTYAERQQVWAAWETVSRAADTSSVSIDSLPRHPG